MKKVFIIHGWAYSTEKWRPCIDALKKRDIDAQLLNVPGLSAPLEEVRTINDYVRWLVDSINEDTPAVLIGHSNGGRIALHLAVQHPQLVKQLILIDSAGIPRRDLPAIVKRSVFKTLASGGKRLTNNSKARQILYKLARQSDYLETSPEMRPVMSNLLESDYRFDPTQVRCPTDLIWGEEDRVTPLSIAKEFKKTIVNSRLHIINGARHSPQYTHVQQAADLIEEIVYERL